MDQPIAGRTVQARVFESNLKSWEDMAKEVSEFASPLGPQRLISISMSSTGGGD